METTSLIEKIALLEKGMALLREECQRLRKVGDVQEIQNVMSMHEYYHVAGMHREEMEAIWAKKTPGIAMEEAFLNGRYVGLEAVEGYYVDFFALFFENARREVRGIFPQVGSETEGAAPFGLQIMHTLTTPVIEVAEDGQTAKGVWLSPGCITVPVGGKLQALWHWDRYAIDFAKEDGRWKIWHFWVGKEFSTPYEKSWVDSALDSTPGVQFDNIPGFPRPNSPSLATYGGYSPFKAPQFVPIPPVPYRTFSETFSY